MPISLVPTVKNVLVITIFGLHTLIAFVETSACPIPFDLFLSDFRFRYPYSTRDWTKGLHLYTYKLYRIFHIPCHPSNCLVSCYAVHICAHLISRCPISCGVLCSFSILLRCKHFILFNRCKWVQSGPCTFEEPKSTETYSHIFSPSIPLSLPSKLPPPCYYRGVLQRGGYTFPMLGWISFGGGEGTL